MAERGPDYVIGSIGTLFVTICRRAPRLAMLEAIDRTEGAFIARVRAPIRSLFILRDIALVAPPDAEFRAKSDYLMQKYTPSLVGTAQVIEGAGFGASLMRGFITGVTIVSRQKVPTRAFATVDAAVGWLAGLGVADPVLEDRAAIAAAIVGLAG